MVDSWARPYSFLFSSPDITAKPKDHAAMSLKHSTYYQGKASPAFAKIVNPEEFLIGNWLRVLSGDWEHSERFDKCESRFSTQHSTYFLLHTQLCLVNLHCDCKPPGKVTPHAQIFYLVYDWRCQKKKKELGVLQHFRICIFNLKMSNINACFKNPPFQPLISRGR